MLYGNRWSPVKRIPQCKINIGMLLRNGSTWFGFTPRNHIPSNIPSYPVSQQFRTHRCHGVYLLLVTLKIASELVRIFLDKIDCNVFYMCLSYIAQINHPSDIGFRNTVWLFKVTARKNPGRYPLSAMVLIKKGNKKKGR